MAERHTMRHKAAATGGRSRRRDSKSNDDSSARLKGLATYLSEPDARDFDRLVYERVRLGILSALAVSRSMTFSELKNLLDTTDGNLSAHARKLEDAGYIKCRKSFAGRTPRTEYRLSAAGRRALERYLDHMEALIESTRA